MILLNALKPTARKVLVSREGFCFNPFHFVVVITELYLAQGKKRQKHWDSLALHLGKLGVKPEVIEHLRSQDKPELVATLVKKLMEKG